MSVNKFVGVFISETRIPNEDLAKLCRFVSCVESYNIIGIPMIAITGHANYPFTESFTSLRNI